METTGPYGSPGEEAGAIAAPAGMAGAIDAANGAAETPALDAESPGLEADSETLARMCFRIGELGLLFPSTDGREVIAPPPVSRVPHTVSWMCGLANVRGELVPVVDAAAAFGVPRQAGMPAYLLIFGQGESTLGVLIDGLPRSIRVSAAERLPAPPGVPQLLADSVVAAYEHAGRVWLDLDLDVLLDRLARYIALG